MNVMELAAIIDDELAEQASIQSGCWYERMEPLTGCASGNMNIVVSQLARVIWEKYSG